LVRSFSRIGVFGVIAFTVCQRERELGIRMALGSSEYGIVAIVFRAGMKLALIGLCVGLFAAEIGARSMASLLYGVSPNNPAVLLTIPLTLAAAAGLACCLPARRGARIDPMIALRAE
jgi:putative ABC transport system permease protein